MADRFVYTGSVGCFLFGEDGRVVEAVLFSDAAAANRRLEGNEWLDEEKKLLRGGRVLFLGFKGVRAANVVFTNDLRKLEAAASALRQYDGKKREVMLKVAMLKVKDSVHGDDVIAQAVGFLQDADKSINLLAKRLKEWNGLVNPELSMIGDNEVFIRKVLSGSVRSEMGAELSQEDLAEVMELAHSLESLLALRKRVESYLEGRMKAVCPNVASVAGVAVGGKLVAAAGSLRRLAVMPASTLQLLGAERSMFNFLRHKSKKMPRFGILHEHALIASANEKKKGRMARLLADKISIAARVDFFGGKFVGDKLLAEIKVRSK